MPQEFQDQVDSLVTDSVTQANVTSLGNAPAVSVDQTYLSQAQAQGVLFANMVNNQQQLAMAGQATAIESTVQIYNMGPNKQPK